MARNVTVRQTLDPYIEDVQYIASYETTLTPSGELDLSTIGIERERTFIMKAGAGLISFVDIKKRNIFPSRFVKVALSHDPILTIVELNDDSVAYDRYDQRLNDQRRAERVEYIKGLFSNVTSRILSAFGSLTAARDPATHPTPVLQDRKTDT